MLWFIIHAFLLSASRILFSLGAILSETKKLPDVLFKVSVVENYPLNIVKHEIVKNLLARANACGVDF